MVTLVAAGVEVELTKDLVEATKARLRALAPGEVLEITVRDRAGDESWVLIPHGCPVMIQPRGDGAPDSDEVLSVARPGLRSSSRAAPVAEPFAVLEADGWPVGRTLLGALSWRGVIAEVVAEWARPERVRLASTGRGRVRVAYDRLAAALPVAGATSRFRS